MKAMILLVAALLLIATHASALTLADYGALPENYQLAMVTGAFHLLAGLELSCPRAINARELRRVIQAGLRSSQISVAGDFTVGMLWSLRELRCTMSDAGIETLRGLLGRPAP